MNHETMRQLIDENMRLLNEKCRLIEQQQHENEMLKNATINFETKLKLVLELNPAITENVDKHAFATVHKESTNSSAPDVKYKIQFYTRSNGVLKKTMEYNENAAKNNFKPRRIKTSIYTHKFEEVNNRIDLCNAFTGLARKRSIEQLYIKVCA